MLLAPRANGFSVFCIGSRGLGEMMSGDGGLLKMTVDVRLWRTDQLASGLPPFPVSPSTRETSRGATRTLETEKNTLLVGCSCQSHGEPL